jgi:glutaminyl-peptide cyclotransferase
LRAPRLLIFLLAIQIVVGGVFILAAASDFWQDDDGGSPQASVRKVDRFDSKRAFALLREQVEEYGPRPAGSDALRRLSERLSRDLPRPTFEALPRSLDRSGELRNVVGTIRGTRPAIVIGAHYDTKDTPRGFLGANDGAGGTAAVVELSRSMRRLRRRRGAPELRFVLFDGEEAPKGCEDFLRCGVRGSRAYVRAHRREIGAMILLDFVAEKNTRIPREATSDIELWGRLRAAARKVGHQRTFPDQVGDAIQDDHTPFLEAGIPSINLIDFDFPQWHTLGDDMDVVSEASLNATGETVAQLLLDWQQR